MARFVRLVSILALAAACGKDSSSPTPPPPPPPPPPPASFTCLGGSLPTTATDPVVVSGVVQGNVTAPAPVSGATLDAFRTGNVTALATTTSAANGNYALSIATGGTPVDGYVRVTKTGYLDLYVYPPVPLVANSTQSLLLLTTSEFGFLGTLAGVTQTAGNGFVAVIVTGCNGTSFAGATVASNPAATVRYNGTNGLPSSTATSTRPDGVAYIFNLTAGDVIVSADSGSKTLRQHTVNARADVFTLTRVRPGP